MNSYTHGNYNIFNITNRTHYGIGKDCKEYVSLYDV